MKPCQIVMDTSVLICALRSRRGASFELLRTIGGRRWQLHLSTALLLEYEAVARREAQAFWLQSERVKDVLDCISGRAQEHAVSFLWRPFLSDPGRRFCFGTRGGGKGRQYQGRHARPVPPEIERDTMTTISAEIPDAVLEQARTLAEREKLPLQQIISLAVTQSVGIWSAESYLALRGKRASREKFLKALEQVPDVEPAEFDKR